MPIRSAQANIQVPNELLSAIINDLAAECNGTTQAALASCRLASSVLCSLATPLFFSSLKWSYQGSHRYPVVSFFDRGTKLARLLSNHNIAGLVHTFTLCCGGQIVGQKWKVGPLISEILYLLQRIRNLTFKLHWITLLFPFSSLTSDFASAIEALCKSPNLTTLELSRIMGFPLKFIALCPNLRCLRLTGVDSFAINDGNSMDETSGLRPSCLDSLEIDVIEPYACAGSQIAKSFSGIRNIRIKSLFAQQSEWNLILLASQTLTTLDLTRHGESKTRPLSNRFLKDFPFDLGQLPALRLLKIQLEILSPHKFSMLTFLNSLLSNSSSASGIETLDLQFILHHVDSEGEIAHLLASGGGWRWDTLDKVLTRETFASLRKVFLDWSLEVPDRHRNSGYDTLALSYVNDLFPMLRSEDSRTLETHVKYF